MSEQRQDEYKQCIHCGGNVVLTKDYKVVPEVCQCGYRPLTKKSEQPHGEQTLYCPEHGYVKRTSFGGVGDLCPYHQRSYQSEEGTVRMYDEFNDDGEEW